MTYTETLERLATATTAAVTALHARLEAGELTLPEFRALAVGALLRAHARGVALADLALAVSLTGLRGEDVLPVGLAVPDDAERAATEAVDAAVADERWPVAPLVPLSLAARSYALAAAQDAYADGMRQQGVEAWTRVLNSGACELCQDLAGDVLPGHAPMYHHKGCGCTQRPVERERAAA